MLLPRPAVALASFCAGCSLLLRPAAAFTTAPRLTGRQQWHHTPPLPALQAPGAAAQPQALQSSGWLGKPPAPSCVRQKGPPARAGGSRLRMLDPATATAAATTLLSAADVSAWSVTSVTSDLAAEIFQASLLPYLAFLFFLSRPETRAPEGGTFGFAFLLVFVVATIPAGIIAKVQYNDILANVDYLHGLAESFLTVTNLLIVRAFRAAVSGGTGGKPELWGAEKGGTVLRSGVVATTLAAGLAAAPMLLAGVHPEPANALSFPTWMVHVSSLIEWLIAMAYVWRYAGVSGLEQWKGLTWGMVPLHTSGLCACTYHIFYNAPELSGLVALQAALTCFGNSTLALATWRVWQAGKLQVSESPEPAPSRVAAAAAGGGAARRDSEPAEKGAPGGSDDLSFYGQLLAITVAGSALVKYGELALDFPFQPGYAAALALILGPTAVNVKKWADRSASPEAGQFEGFL